MELEGLVKELDGGKKMMDQFKSTVNSFVFLLFVLPPFTVLKQAKAQELKLGNELTIKDDQIARLVEELRDAQEKCHYFESEVFCTPPLSLPTFHIVVLTQLDGAKSELSRTTQSDTGTDIATHTTISGFGVSPDFVSPEVREKMVRLERENDELKAQLADQR